MLTLLFASIEGAADTLADGHAHAGNAVHQLLSDDAPLPLDSNTDFTPQTDHCEHCCHGHVSSITTQIVLTMAPLMANDHQVAQSAHVPNFAKAPPTPPPDA